QVVDSEGAGVPGATVVIEGTNRGAAADVDGNYSVGGLQAGTYSVKVSSIGYNDVVVEGVVIRPNATTTQNFTLEEEGGEGEGDVIVVTAERTPVDAQRTGTE